MGGYDFYYGRVRSPGIQMTIDVHGVSGSQTVAQRFKPTFLLDDTLLVDPMNVTSVKGKTLASRAVRGAMVEALALGLVFAVWGLLV
jgi:hypothetical protein